MAQSRTREEIASRLEQLTRQYGEWTFNIPLPHGIWTAGKLHEPHTRLKRIVQVASDLCMKPLSQCRILDLGCLEGMFAIEFAIHGAEAVGIEVREANIEKALFCKEVLQLDKLTFLKEDVRNVDLASLGHFDAIICSGILYHLTAQDALALIQRMHAMATRVVIIDTHVELTPPPHRVTLNDAQYWGREVREHAAGSTKADWAGRLWASWGNETSFIFSRPSLVNLLASCGFSSVYECFVPAHINYGQPGLEFRNRCTLVAVKGEPQSLATSPQANALRERWPEGSLSYGHSANPGLWKRLFFWRKRA
jgi:2-polyprenyl-3-methyl-5-hydroxy-6-metoxy-1,4-benzoquinol methylase